MLLVLLKYYCFFGNSKRLLAKQGFRWVSSNYASYGATCRCGSPCVVFDSVYGHSLHVCPVPALKEKLQGGEGVSGCVYSCTLTDETTPLSLTTSVAASEWIQRSGEEISVLPVLSGRTGQGLTGRRLGSSRGQGGSSTGRAAVTADHNVYPDSLLVWEKHDSNLQIQSLLCCSDVNRQMMHQWGFSLTAAGTLSPLLTEDLDRERQLVSPCGGDVVMTVVLKQLSLCILSLLFIRLTLQGRRMTNSHPKRT